MSGNVDRRREDGEAHSGYRGREPNRLPEHPATEYVFRVVEYADRQDEGTICPRSIDREQLLTTWLTARRSAFVDLDERR